MPDLETLAIKAALSGDWQKAIEFNNKILKKNPRDINALNRLGRAYAEIGKIELAKKTYRKVLRIERFNPIASRNLQKLKLLKEKKPVKEKPFSLPQTTLFIEEAGKTKTVSLVYLAPSEVLSTLNCGDPLILVPKKRRVSVYSKEGVFLGALPDDLSHRLHYLIKGGNEYQAYVKSVEKNSLVVFIKETKRAKRFRNLSSFPTKERSSSF